MSQISGRAIRGLLKFVKESSYPGGPTTLVGLLPAEHRHPLDTTIRTSAWYPYAAYAALLRLVQAELGHGEATVLRELGQASLRRDASSLLRILSVFSTVESLVTRGFGTWGSFLWGRHCDTGRVALAGSGEGWAAMGLHEFPGISVLHCQVIAGYLEEMGRSVGALRLRVVETHCVHRGDSHCQFEGRWSRPGDSEAV